jgi:hypothetical protein
MPKKYEDEIREILKGMDDLPDDGSRGSRRSAAGRPSGRTRGPVFRAPTMPSLRFDPQRIMGLALILILLGWIMQGPWARGFRDILVLAGYVSLAGTILLVVALVALLRASGWFKGNFAQAQQRWRGQVIYLPNRQPFWTRWRHALQRLFRGWRRPGPSAGGPRGSGGSGGPRRGGRDSYQW